MSELKTISAKSLRGKRATLQMIDDFGIDKEKLDKILESFIVIGNINPIPKNELIQVTT